MARRLILGGTVAIAVLLAASSAHRSRLGAGRAWTCPAAEKAKKNPVAKSDAAVGRRQEADRRQGVHRLPRRFGEG